MDKAPEFVTKDFIRKHLKVMRDNLVPTDGWADYRVHHTDRIDQDGYSVMRVYRTEFAFYIQNVVGNEVSESIRESILDAAVDRILDAMYGGICQRLFQIAARVQAGDWGREQTLEALSGLAEELQ